MNLRQILQKIKLAGAPTIGHLSSMIDAFVTRDELTKAVSSITPNTGTGGTGPAGPTGAAGADGKTVLNGSGAPSSGLGTNGDFYIDTTADAIYGPKTGGSWGGATSLIGATGAAGPGLPAGGTIGQIPRKNSSTDYDVSWVANTAGAIAAQFLKNLAATTLTGVAVETRFVSILIPANTFSSGSAFEVSFRFGRNSTTGSCGFKMYLNTSDAVGGVNIAAFVTGAGNITATVQRLLTIRSATETHHFTTASGIASDLSISGTALLTSNINWTVNQYLVVSLTPAASGQLHTHFSTMITPK
jgi:hypothetical protein